MDKSIKFSTIPKSRWKDYRNLRIEAVKHSPTSFSTTPKEEKTFEQEHWESKLDKNNLSKLIFALDENNIVGMIALRRSKKKKSMHRANIGSFYVKPDYRGQGIGKHLLLEVVKLARSLKLKKLELSVYTENPAQHLYHKIGFKENGRTVMDMIVKDKEVGHIHMDMFLE